MKVELDSLIAQHPGVEESMQAQEIVDYMYVEFPEIKEAEEAKVAEVIYREYDPEQEHYFLIALHSSENVNQVSFDLLNFNLDYFNQYDLEIQKVALKDSYNMLSVSKFTNSETALRYLEVIAENRDTILVGIDPSKYRLMVISEHNFRLLEEQKQFNPYYLFYLNHYLKEEE